MDASTITLTPEDTKTDEPRLMVLTSRAKEALRTLASRFKRKGYVFVNPKKKTRWVEIKKRLNSKSVAGRPSRAGDGVSR